MTDKLTKYIQNIIEKNGAISVQEYWEICMLHPEYGYYSTKNPIANDFITAPEISQMFGELIAVWIVEAWNKLGKPNPVCLMEIGPGRGTLTKDMIRTIKKIAPQFLEATNITLVEPSKKFRDAQKNLLGGEEEGTKIKWENNVRLPKMPVIVIGNEVLDALPIKQWIKNNNQWKERKIKIKNQKLCFVTHNQTLKKFFLDEGHLTQPDGTIFETSPQREEVIKNIANHINEHQGVALFVDYGHVECGFGDTLQAVKNHKYVNPLQEPGNADITSHVDFEALTKITSGICDTPKPTTQAKFLEELGIIQRAEILKKGKDQMTKNKIDQDLERLTGETEMGNLFKVMAFGSIKQWHGFN